MNARRFAQVVPNLFLLVALTLFQSPLLAQDWPQSEVENSKYQILGMVNANAVFVRSGPSDNDYATMKLDKGAQVVVVGERFNWLKILPPEGSFCYVAKAYVNRSGNGSFGIVTTTLNVRIGSLLNPLKTKVAAKLEPNQRVEILGEQDEYFKIKPPQGVYLYINKQYVDPVRTLNAGETVAPADAPAQQTLKHDLAAAAATAAPADAGAASAAATTMPAEQSTAAAPATQPAADAEIEFDRLEALYAQASQRPLDEQPIAELLNGYEALAANGSLPESMRRICDFKISVLKARAEALADFLGAKKVQEDMKQKQMALQAEQQELEQRIRKTDVQFYTAVGTLRASSLQQGQQTLYRLTDPANGRTVIYLRSDEPRLGQYIGQFIGVRGQVVDDSQLNLRFITPTFFEPVNPAKVGTSVAAQIAPASLLPGSTASTGE